MRVTAVALLLTLAACGSPGSSATADADGVHLAAQPWERDPFTQTSLIEIDGIVVGYLVEYQAIPATVDVERAFPEGSYRIQGVDFEDIGFISPRGEVHRFTGVRSESLGSWSLDAGLRTFFGGGGRVRLTTLAPTPAKARAAEPAAEGAAPEGSGGEAGSEPSSEEASRKSGG